MKSAKTLFFFFLIHHGYLSLLYRTHLFPMNLPEDTKKACMVADIQWQTYYGFIVS